MSATDPQPDPVLLEVMKGEFVTIVEEMCTIMGQTARSIGARDGGDFVASIINPAGQVVARGGVPAWYVGNTAPHMLKKFGTTLRPGDIVIGNDPYTGATHLPDLVLLMPVFFEGELLGYVGNAMHHTDMGGYTSGGMSPKPTELYQEGLLIPAVLLYKGGEPVEAVHDIIRANTRAPVDVMGDLQSQVSGCFTAARDFQHLAERYGAKTVHDYGRHIISYSERAVREAIRSIPDGRYGSETVVDTGTDAPPVKVALTLMIDGDEMICDFTGTGPQSASAVNVPPASVAGNLLEHFSHVFEIDVPSNSGLLTPFRLVQPEGTVVNPRRPAAVGARSTVTNQLPKLLLSALAQALPDRVPAEGPTATILLFTPDRPGGGSMLFDLWMAGSGARPLFDGHDGPKGRRRISGEAMEADVGVALEGYGLVDDTAGAGRFRGGAAVFRQYRFLEPGRAWIRNLYAGHRPEGLMGGKQGVAGVLIATIGGEVIDYSDRYGGEIRVSAGDTLYQASHSGAGHGDPFERDPQAVLADVLDGIISSATAEEDYGVVIVASEIDDAATKARRAAG